MRYWYEIDSTYDMLRVLTWLGLVWDLRTPPEHVLTSNLEAPQKAPGVDSR